MIKVVIMNKIKIDSKISKFRLKEMIKDVSIRYSTLKDSKEKSIMELVMLENTSLL